MDWKNIISDLQTSGLSRSEIAEKCGCSKVTIDKIAIGERGKNLSFKIANPLKQLHEGLTKKRSA